MQIFLKAILAAIIGGGATGAATAATSGNARTIGAAAIAGALIAVAHLFQEKPGSEAK